MIFNVFWAGCLLFAVLLAVVGIPKTLKQIYQEVKKDVKK